LLIGSKGFSSRIFSLSVRLNQDPQLIRYKLLGSNRTVHEFLIEKNCEKRAEAAWMLLLTQCDIGRTDRQPISGEFVRMAFDFFSGKEVKDDEHYSGALLPANFPSFNTTSNLYRSTFIEIENGEGTILYQCWIVKFYQQACNNLSNQLLHSLVTDFSHADKENIGISIAPKSAFAHDLEQLQNALLCAGPTNIFLRDLFMNHQLELALTLTPPNWAGLRVCKLKKPIAITENKLKQRKEASMRSEPLVNDPPVVNDNFTPDPSPASRHKTKKNCRKMNIKRIAKKGVKAENKQISGDSTDKDDKSENTETVLETTQTDGISRNNLRGAPSSNHNIHNEKGWNLVTKSQKLIRKSATWRGPTTASAMFSPQVRVVAKPVTGFNSSQAPEAAVKEQLPPKLKDFPSLSVHTQQSRAEPNQNNCSLSRTTQPMEATTPPKQLKISNSHTPMPLDTSFGASTRTEFSGTSQAPPESIDDIESTLSPDTSQDQNVSQIMSLLDYPHRVRRRARTQSNPVPGTASRIQLRSRSLRSGKQLDIEVVEDVDGADYSSTPQFATSSTDIEIKDDIPTDSYMPDGFTSPQTFGYHSRASIDDVAPATSICTSSIIYPSLVPDIRFATLAPPSVSFICTFCHDLKITTLTNKVLLCSGCGFESNIRYCTCRCMLADAFNHSSQCMRLHSWLSQIPNLQKIPMELSIFKPNGLPRLCADFETPALFRQKAFSMWCYSGHAIVNNEFDPADPAAGEYFVFESTLTGNTISTSTIIYT
jgi:hypothetical protein